MGWCQSFTANIELNKTSYHSSYEVDSKIEDNNSLKELYKKNLIKYAITNPKDYVEEEMNYSETLDYITNEVERILEDYDNLCVENYILDLFSKNWDIRSGDYTYNSEYKENIKKFIKENILPEINHQKYLKQQKGSD